MSIQEGPPVFEGKAEPEMSNGEDKAPVVGYEAGKYRIIRLDATDHLSRSIFEKFVQRAMGFIDRTGSETDKIWLGKLLYGTFAENDKRVLFLVALDDESNIKAHVVAYPELYQSLGAIGHVLQIEKDVDEPEIMNVGMRLIEEWAKGLGMKTLMNSTATRAHSRLFEKYGFYEYRIQMRADLVD